jgi:membrane peptidoglycan carboxypeptidase
MVRKRGSEALRGSGRSRRWVGPPAGEEGRRGDALVFVALVLFVVAAIGGWTWASELHLRDGLLRQRQEAMAREDWVPLGSLPPHVAEAFLSVVDPTFYRRGVIDDGQEGITVSRALVGQIHVLGDGILGEARKRVMGPLLEAHLTRRAVLELFLNRVELGRSGEWGVFGIHHAAIEYLGKDPRALTVGEAASLAGILLPPRIPDPTDVPGAMGIRRNEVLRQMVLRGVIDQDAYRTAVAEPLGFQPGISLPPMTRPAGWAEPVPPIHVPAPTPDTTDAGAAARER